MLRLFNFQSPKILSFWTKKTKTNFLLFYICKNSKNFFKIVEIKLKSKIKIKKKIRLKSKQILRQFLESMILREWISKFQKRKFRKGNFLSDYWLNGSMRSNIIRLEEKRIRFSWILTKWQFFYFIRKLEVFSLLY